MEQVTSGQLLKAILQTNKFTLDRVADLISMSRPNLSKLVNRGGLTVDHVERIARATNIDLAIVIEAMGKEPTPRPPGRCEQLESENEKLREDLEQANETIRNLSVSIRALTAPK